MAFISQTDPRWNLKKINGTTYTINSYGCLITDICWILGQAGYSVTPDELAKKSDLFDGAMWIGWDKLKNHYPNMQYVWGERCTDYPAPIEKITKELDDGYYPIIMLDYAPKTNGLQTHYLTCIGHDGNGNIKVGDPIDGQEVWLDSRYGELDEKYKILKIDVYHFPKQQPTQSGDPCDAVRTLLFVENNYSESDIRAMVDWYNQKDATERKIQEINAEIVDKNRVIAEKDQVIFELNNQLAGKDETIKHYADFQDKLAVIFDCQSDQGIILSEAVTAVGSEAELQACLTDKNAITVNMNNNIQVEVEKATFELRLKLAEQNMIISRMERDIVNYQKRIDILSLGKVITHTPTLLKIQNFINKLLKKNG